MKITIKIKDAEVTLEESGDNFKMSTMRYAEENALILKTIETMAEACVKIIAISKK